MNTTTHTRTYLHNGMINDAFPAGRPLQEVVDLTLERCPQRVPSLCLYKAPRHLTPLRWASVQGQLHGACNFESEAATWII